MNKCIHNKIKSKISLLVLLIMLSVSAQRAYATSENLPNNNKSLVEQVQDTKINIDIVNKNFSEVMADICRKANIKYGVGKGVHIDENKKYSFKEDNISIENALKNFLRDTPYSFTYENGTILIINKQPVKMVTITGKVVDENGKPVVGATIIVKGSNKGAITDDKGIFRIHIEVGAILEISCTGMKDKEHTVTLNDSVLTIALEKAESKIDDVVVTGVFDRPRESYTGSVKTVTARELKQYKGQNLLMTLRNIDPAVNIVVDNAMGSNPNREFEVKIRGNSSLPANLDDATVEYSKQLNSPLVIMDGFEISIEELMDFNDEEIESINILKDASATAIYGSRGANGVFVIKTKDPEAGKLRVTVNAGINLEVPDLSSYNLMNASEKLALEKLIGFYDSSDPLRYYELQNLYNERISGTLQGETEWIREPVRVGVGRNLKAKIEGGTERFRWGVDISNNNTIGTMKGSERDVTNASFTIMYNHKGLQVRNKASFSSTKADNGSYGSFSDYAELNPYFRVTDENGELIEDWKLFSGTPVPNPLVDASLPIKDYSTNMYFRNQLSIDWQINEELTVRGQLGISKGFNQTHNFLPGSHSSFNYSNISFFEKGSYDLTDGESLDLEGNISINYVKVFNEKHQLYAGLQASFIDNESYGYSFSTRGYVNPSYTDFSNAISYANGSIPVGSDNLVHSVGFTANVNYTYDSRIFVDASYRLDGSSQFGVDQRFAPFWTVGAGWNVHNERFTRNLEFLSALRLRASIGESGSMQFSPYEARSMYQFTNSSRYLTWTSAGLMGIGNPDLTWQTTRQTNIGIELGLFDGRITAGIDIFNKETDDLLSSTELKPSSGFDNYRENIGATKNSGFEAKLGYNIISDVQRRITWNVSANVAYTKNIITSLSDEITRQSQINLERYEYGNILFEGYSQNSIYAVRSLGVDPMSGQELFLDKDDMVTTTWQNDARVYVGVEEPLYIGNLSSTFSYKNFTINLSFGYHWGGYQYNQTLIDKVELQRGTVNSNSINFGMAYNVDKRVLTERWQEIGDITFYKGYGDLRTKPSTRFVMKDNVFQLQSVALQYRWNTPFVTNKLKSQGINFSVNMSDLFYLSSIDRERGTSYPFANNIQFTTSITF